MATNGAVASRLSRMCDEAVSSLHSGSQLAPAAAMLVSNLSAAGGAGIKPTAQIRQAEDQPTLGEVNRRRTVPSLEKALYCADRAAQPFRGFA